MMIFSLSFLCLFFNFSFAVITPRQVATHSPCRFSPLYTQTDILRNSSAFVADIFYWEGQFHQNGVGYNTANGLTYDGVPLNLTTGFANFSQRHQFSAASKEALQIMVYTHAIAGDPLAARFVYPYSTSTAPQWAVAMLYAKLQAYLAFNRTYPGYGGYIPWFLANGTAMRPQTGWENRVPALDNGELLWALYAAVHVLHQSKVIEYYQLGDAWEEWLNYTKSTAATVFYRGNGGVCAVANFNQTLVPSAPNQNYTCEGGDTAVLNDPYEGELFTWWLYFFGNISNQDKELLWSVKRPQLQAVNYTGSIVNTSYDYAIATNYSGNRLYSFPIRPITVQKGFWFSSHEQWKILEMPYLDNNLVRRVFHNAERVRTCNSVLMGRNPGMFASVNNVTNPQTNELYGYISYAGIPSVSFQQEQELDVITPYSVFPTIMFNKSVGLAWYKNMLDGKGMQNPYGSTEALRRDGTGISALVTWDSKVTTIVALLGGVGNFTARQMKLDGIYNTFIDILGREYGRVFGNASGKAFVGEERPLCLPRFRVPVRNVTDFTMCSLNAI